jgi:NitT/TauT family transport system ATP-binding protein
LTTVLEVTAPTAISIQSVSKAYGDGKSTVQALADVNLEVAEGEFICLLGASGCGKSTLLNLIAGLYKVNRGKIETEGRKVGFVFQEPALFPWLTVAENVDSGMRFAGVPKAEREARVNDLLEMVSLNEFADHRPHQLSGGMQQRTALARALAQETQILLMDEPFGALDAMTRSVLHDELEQIWERTGTTIVFVTHDVREAVRLGDRVVVLSSRPGRVIADHPVPLDRPRSLDSDDVGHIAAEITAQLREEVRRHAGR